MLRAAAAEQEGERRPGAVPKVPPVGLKRVAPARAEPVGRRVMPARPSQELERHRALPTAKAFNHRPISASALVAATRANSVSVPGPTRPPVSALAPNGQEQEREPEEQEQELEEREQATQRA